MKQLYLSEWSFWTGGFLLVNSSCGSSPEAVDTPFDSLHHRLSLATALLSVSMWKLLYIFAIYAIKRALLEFLGSAQEQFSLSADRIPSPTRLASLSFTFKRGSVDTGWGLWWWSAVIGEFFSHAQDKRSVTEQANQTTRKGTPNSSTNGVRQD